MKPRNDIVERFDWHTEMLSGKVNSLNFIKKTVCYTFPEYTSYFFQPDLNGRKTQGFIRMECTYFSSLHTKLVAIIAAMPAIMKRPAIDANKVKRKSIFP